MQAVRCEDAPTCLSVSSGEGERRGGSAADTEGAKTSSCTGTVKTEDGQRSGVYSESKEHDLVLLTTRLLTEELKAHEDKVENRDSQLQTAPSM